MAFLKKALDPLSLGGGDSPEEMGVVFVTSGTSVVGRRVVDLLLDAGYDPKSVRVGVYKGDRQFGVHTSVGESMYNELEAKGTTAITFDITDEASWTMALAGVKTVFCTIPLIAPKGTSDKFSKFVKACKTSGVEHFVKSSFYHHKGGPATGDPYSIVPSVKFEHACDDILEKEATNSHGLMGEKSNMTYTILATAHWMSNAIVQQEPVLRSNDHKYVTASYDMGVNYVSPNDVSKVAVAALTNRKDHKNKTYDLTGPSAIKDKDVAELLSEFMGAKVVHVPLGYHEFVAERKSKARGMPGWLVEEVSTMEKAKASGIEEDKAAYTKDIETITGKKPETFKAYLANKDAMTPAEDPGRATI